jgi:hypothetical protein
MIVIFIKAKSIFTLHLRGFADKLSHASPTPNRRPTRQPETGRGFSKLTSLVIG